MPTKNSSDKQPLRALLTRHFTTEGVDPFTEIEWETRTAKIGSFEQNNVEVPSFWSQNATNIVAQKYFAYGLDDKRRERSVKTMISRVVHKMAEEGEKNGYFTADEKTVFIDELKYILVYQLASFNSPVWFNIGVKGAPQVSSACYILSVKDSLDSITTWYKEEGKIFQAGSGAGVNLSKIRGAGEPLSRGGFSSGAVTFMRGADANAGTIQSGGVTRRAAKLVCLDVDHPDIEDFIWCKSREEERIRALKEAGFDMSMDGREMAEATSYQNANNSVRVTDEFMKAVEANELWQLKGRQSDKVDSSLPARDLFAQIAEAAWRCADPGLQYDTTMNEWHTTPAQGRNTATNPCSEYVSNDNTSCNLASLNLLRFLDNDNHFDVAAYRHTVQVIFTAQEITISFADFPTKEIEKNTRALRQIGIGYTNLGALLMNLGLPYDSEQGRDVTSAVTSLLTAEAYLQSTHLAERMGAFEHFQENKDQMLHVLDKHHKESKKLDSDTVFAAKEGQKLWAEVNRRARKYGVRNAQASVLAPTGTISFMMDSDTTGIEPEFSLIKYKTLVGGGNMQIINRAVPRALSKLGYTENEIEEIISYIGDEVNGQARNSVVGAPHLKDEHYPIFDCAIGDRSIRPMGHVRMMAAAQPFISGAISKTVNVPSTATVDEIQHLYVEGWRLGLKALAIYRDGCKANQPLSSSKESATDKPLERGQKRELPRNALVEGVNFRLGPPGQQVSGYINVRLFEDGTPGQLFVDVGQAGSTLHGFIRAWAVTFSTGLQYGVPLDAQISKLAFAQFEPSGLTDDPNVRRARSIVDFIVRWLAANYLDPSVHSQLGIINHSQDNVTQEELLPGGEIESKTELHAETVPSVKKKTPLHLSASTGGADVCRLCGGSLIPTGTCMTCSDCGDTSGCG